MLHIICTLSMQIFLLDLESSLKSNGVNYVTYVRTNDSRMIGYAYIPRYNIKDLMLFYLPMIVNNVLCMCMVCICVCINRAHYSHYSWYLCMHCCSGYLLSKTNYYLQIAVEFWSYNIDSDDNDPTPPQEVIVLTCHRVFWLWHSLKSHCI